MSLVQAATPAAGADGHPRMEAAPAPLVELKNITKAFGPTLANAGIDLAIHSGEILGLVGGNGAGKSTLMRILCGVTAPSLGAIVFDGSPVAPALYDPGEAQRLGIRMVHQELSLCTNLSVAENFFVEAPDRASLVPGWRRLYHGRAREALAAVFPGHDIDVGRKVSQLSIGQRQMVEIARAAATPGVRLIILDEPTSSLDQERSRQLRAYMRERSKAELSFIFISHKLHEVVEIASRIAVLRNGKLIWQGPALDAPVARLVHLMGGQSGAASGVPAEGNNEAAEVLVTLRGDIVAPLGRELSFRRGEIVGLAGLEGSGQKPLLHQLFTGRNGRNITRGADASFVSGDRQREGVFPLWSVLGNIGIGRIAKRFALSLVSDKEEANSATGPAGQLRLDPGRFHSNITELSGGNQQKALVARALVADAAILLLDDPTRGVDIATKQDFYKLTQNAAAGGRLLFWHTTEDSEFLLCDRVLVFSEGRIVAELGGSEITEDAIVAASFSHRAGNRSNDNAGDGWQRLRGWLGTLAPIASLAAVLAVMSVANPNTATVFGLDLLLMPAVALVLVAMAQMFIIGGSEIDLGAGAFAALVSVLAATLLADQPLWGLVTIVAALAAYCLLGALIQARSIPAIVVTLGASFIWLGIGYSIQPTPGGYAPEWLMQPFFWSLPGIPVSIILIAAVGVIAWSIDRTWLGVVLRGFGNNADAMRRSGWSPVRYALVRYLIAGLFATAAGLALTGMNTASDINSGSSFTLLSVAAVVMGGCALAGGIISPTGAVVGAVTLSLIGALLGMLNVSSDFNAMTQGLLLLGLLAIRNFSAGPEED